MQVSCTSVTRNCLCSFHTTDFHAPMPSLMLLSTRHTPFLVQSIICHPQDRCLSSMVKFYLLFTSNSPVTSCINLQCSLPILSSQAKLIILFSIPLSIMYILIVYLHICMDIKQLNYKTLAMQEKDHQKTRCCHWENEDNTTQAVIAKDATLISGGKRKRLF